VKVCIIGLGLIGASMAWQLKSKGHHVTGVARRQKTLDLAYEQNLIDAGYLEVCRSALQVDLVVVAVPLELIVSTIVHIDTFLSSQTLVIDVGSVKKHIIDDIKSKYLKKTLFVGGHPMAGSEKTGLENFQKDLFSGKPFILCYPSDEVRKQSTLLLQRFVADLDATVCELSAEDHDQRVAAISHLPYILANTLFNLYLKDEPSLKEVASTGFLDTTRVAHSDPLWGTMVALMNKDALIPQIDAVISSLQLLKSDISTFNSKGLLARFNVDHVIEGPEKLERLKEWVKDSPET